MPGRNHLRGKMNDLVLLLFSLARRGVPNRKEKRRLGWGVTYKPSSHCAIIILAALFAAIAAPVRAAEDSPDASDPATARPKLSARLFGLPMQFEKNAGQTDSQVDFLARGPGYALFLTPTQAVFCLASRSISPANARGSRHHARQVERSRGRQIALRMNLQEANPHPTAEGIDPSPGVISYILGNKVENWHVGVEAFAKVRYQEVYRGIDLVYYGNQRQLEYDFVVSPQANPGLISLSFGGAEKLEVDGAGDLIIQLPGGVVRWHKPLAYQNAPDGRKEVAARFVLKEPNQIGFEVAAYDPARPLVIDPALSYVTYLGGSDDDYSCGIAVDSSGNVFVSGSTYSLNFPITNAFRTTSGGSNEVFVTKINATGTALIYSTYLGGSGNDLAQGLAIDTNGNAYITGVTDSPNFPTKNAFNSANSGFNDAFIAKLGSAGTNLLYASFLGGNGDDSGNAIAVDNSGNAYVAGDTFSIGTGTGKFPVVNAKQANNRGGRDAFVAKFNTTLIGTPSLVYSTFLGGSTDETAFGIAIDSSGNAYVVGNVDASFITVYPDPPASNFPVTNAFQPSFNLGSVDPDAGTTDGFLTKVGPIGNNWVFSTFLGGGDEDSALGVALDSAGRICVIGETSSLDFPSLNGAQPAIGGADFGFPAPDAFVTVFQPSGTNLYYSTFLGGSGYESGFGQYRFGIAVDRFGDIYVAGETESVDDFPLTAGADQTNALGGSDAFVAKINPAVAGPAGLVYSTFLGGDDDDRATGVAVDANGNFYVTGFTSSVTNLATAGAYRGTNSGSTDAFVAKYSSPPDLSVVLLPSVDPVTIGTNLTYTIQIHNNGRTTFTGVTNVVQFSTNIQLLAVSSSAGNWSTNGNRLIFNIGTMTNNAAIVQSITIATPTPVVMTNSATLTSFESASQEPNIGNNVSTVVSTVRGVADVRLNTATAVPNPVALTNNLTLTLTVSNKGPYPASAVELIDVLPPELSFVSVANSQGTAYYDSGVVVCDFTNMANNASATVTILAKAMTNSVTTNFASVSALELDLVPANNSVTQLVTISPPADLAIGMTGPISGFAGTNFTYTLRLTNAGPAAATGITVTDVLPAGAVYVSASNPSGTAAQANGVVTCGISSMASNATATITITAKPLIGGTVTNSASVSSTSADPQLANNSASVVTAVALNLNAPLLKIARSGANAVLSWSTNASGFLLQARPDLSISSSWAAVTNAPIRISDQYFVTNLIGVGPRFYRLSQ